MATHEHYMQIALDLALRASGCVSPGALVGSVVVKDDEIVGRGWHKEGGTAHAEIHALNDAGSDANGSTLYVTLEPCAHHGRTGPCCEAVVKAGVKTVVMAVKDPNPIATGGTQHLLDHGVEVIADVLKHEATFLNRFFFHHQKTTQPYVIAKFAASLDGRIATHTGHSQWITGPEARQRGHTLRQAVDAIIVGADTAIADNPSLTVRLPEAECPPENVRHPLRVVVDSTGRVPLNNSLFDSNLPGKTIVASTSAVSSAHENSLHNKGVEVVRVASSINNRVSLPALMQELGNREAQSVLVEGGQTLLGQFRDDALIDEVWAFIAPMLIGGSHALGSIGGSGADTLDSALRLKTIVTENIGADVLIRGEVDTQRMQA